MGYHIRQICGCRVEHPGENPGEDPTAIARYDRPDCNFDYAEWAMWVEAPDDLSEADKSKVYSALIRSLQGIVSSLEVNLRGYRIRVHMEEREY